MAKTQRLAATITIGGAMQASLKNALSSTSNQIGQVGRSIRELTDRQTRLAAAATHWEKQGRDASRFRSELERVNREMQRQESIRRNLRAQEQNTANRSALRGQLFDAVALGAVLVAPVRTAMKFEQAMAQVGAVSRASAEDMERLTKTARTLGATTNWSASQAAEGMQFLAMAGFSTEQTIAAMPGMLDLASAGAIELGSAADIASNILSGFNMQAEQMGYLGDVLTNAFTSSNTSLSMLGDTMKYVAPVANATGVSLEQTAAMAAKLGDAGIQGSQAGTALRAVISRLASPAGEAATLLEQLGVATVDANGNLREVPDILADLSRSMDGFGTAARADITKTIFGMEAASAATILLGEAGSGSLQTYAEGLKEVGSAARVAAQQNATTTGQFKRLGSAMESISITIGNVLLPHIATVAEHAAILIGYVGALAEQFPMLTTVVVTGTAALIALKITAIAGGYAFTFLRGAWLSAALMGLRLGAVLPVIATGIKAIGLALAANPIGAIITGIAVAGLLIYKYWEPITEFFGNLWTRVTEWFQWAWDKFGGYLGWTPLGMLINNWGAVTQWFGDLWTDTVAIFGLAWDAFKSVLSWHPLALIASNWEPIKGWFDGLWDGIIESASAAFDWIAGKLAWVGSAASRVKSFFGFGSDEGNQLDLPPQPGAAIIRQDEDMASGNRPTPEGLQRANQPAPVSQRNENTYNNTITVYQQPGQDARQLAEEIDRIQRERERGALYDNGMAYGYP